MPKRVFNEDEKLVIKEKLLSVGFPLLQTYGVTHMSIPKITKAAEIGTGTFYHFFDSKEAYLYELIKYKREQFLNELISDDVKTGKRKLTKEEVRSFIELIADRNRSVYANMNLKDEAELFTYMSNEGPNLEHEKQISKKLLSIIEGVKEDIDFALLANMMKVLALTAQARQELHAEGYERTITLLIDSIMNIIY